MAKAKYEIAASASMAASVINEIKAKIITANQWLINNENGSLINENRNNGEYEAAENVARREA